MSPLSSRRKVLIFTLSPPIPSNSGGSIYTANYILPLAERYELHLFVIGGDSERDLIRQHQDQYDSIFKSIHIEPRAKTLFEKRSLRKYVHAISQLLLGLPFIDASYYSASAVRNARKIIRQHSIDALEIHTTHLAFMRRLIPAIPTLLVSHNIEADLFPFWVPADLKGWKKRFFDFIAESSRRNAYRVEIDNSWNFDAMAFISPKDMSRVRASVEKVYLPLCLPRNERDYRSRESDRTKVLWMGNFWWYPNLRGVQWFISEVFPKVADRLEQEKVELHFIGSAPPIELEKLHDNKTVFVHGFVDSVQPMLDSAHLLIAPLLEGGGVRVKILEAMSNGIPVLSTSKGCEGLDVIDGKNIVIRDDPNGFAEALLQLTCSSEWRAALSEEGLTLMRKKYDIASYIAEKDRLYRETLKLTPIS